MNSASTVQIEQWLAQLHAGEVAHEQLLELTCERIRQLAARMFRRNHALRRWEQTDDILQEAMVKLHRALLEIRPETAAQYFALASLQIRRVLIDLGRKHFGPHGQGKQLASVGGEVMEPRPEHDQAELERWSRFHEAVQQLTDESRRIVDLLFYQGLSQADAAQLLAVSERTVKRWWRTAREELHEQLGGEFPDES